MVSLNAIDQIANLNSSPSPDRTLSDRASTSTPREIALSEIGQLLREHRIARGYSLNEVSCEIIIRPVLLQNLEAGNWAALPEPIYVCGFIKTYGNFLGLNGSTLANHIAEPATEPKPRQPHLSKLVTVQLRPIHAWLAYIAVVVGAVLGIGQVLDKSPPAPASNHFPGNLPYNPLARPIAQVQSSSSLDPSPSTAGNPDRPLETWGLASIPKSLPEHPLTVTIQVVESPAWVEVVADRQTVFQGTLDPGIEKEWVADATLKFRTGNAGSVLLSLNGESPHKLGNPGQIEEQRFQVKADGTVDVQ